MAFLYRFPRKTLSTVHPTETCKKVLDILRKNGHDVPGPDTNWRIKRTNAGHHQRSAGAWTWFLDWEGPIDDVTVRSFAGEVGGFWPASICIQPGHQVGHAEFGRLVLDPSPAAVEKFRMRSKKNA